MGSVVAYDTAAGKRYRVRYRKPDRSQTDKRGFKTKREAELFLASVEVAKARGEYVDATAAKVTIGELGAVWLASQTHLKPSALAPVEIAWRVYVKPRWGSTPVGSVRHTEVQTWVSELTLGTAVLAVGKGHRGAKPVPKSATTVLRVYGVLAAILDDAVRDRRITSNEARGVDLPRKVGRPHVYLSHAQAHAFADASGDRRLLILVLAYTGLRWGEAIALRTRDIDLVRRRISVAVNAVEVQGKIVVGTPKTHKRRSVAFPLFLGALLAAALAGKSPDDLLFATPSGEHLPRTRVSRDSRSWFKTALAEAGLPAMTIHDLRHTAASLAVSSGANVKAVQRMLGHASAAMTLDIYADLFDDDLDDVAARLDDAVRRSIVGKTWADAGSSE